jgi:5-methylcytosine-specific restriction endonuclease McrA
LSHTKEVYETKKKYRLDHPDKMRANKHKYRARQQTAEGSNIPFDEKVQFKRQKGKCYYCQCKLDKYHIDHVIPLSRGGTDHPDNKVLACPSCNLKKNDKLPHEWAKGGRLL